jgi:drug/metabolite transporter (DMT)-like permease
MKKGILYSLITTFMFGVSSILYKIFYSMGLNSVSISFYAALFSVISLFVQKLASEKNLKFLKINKRDFFVSFCNNGILGLFVNNVSIVVSLQYVQVGVQQLITNSSSMVVMLIYMLFMHKKPQKQDVISCLLIFAGLFFVVGKITVAQNTGVVVGLAFCFLSMMAVASYSTILMEHPIDCDDTTCWLYAFLAYLIVISIKIMLVDGFNSIIPIGNTVNVLFVFISIYLFCTLSYITYKKGMVALGPVKHLIIIAFSPVISILLGFFLFRESITGLQCVGAALILLSAIVPAFITVSPEHKPNV